MLAGLTLSTKIWFLPAEDLFIVSLIPIDEPGDFSISIKRGPFEFFIESIILNNYCYQFYKLNLNKKKTKQMLHWPTIAESYSIKNRVVPLHCLIIL